MAAPIITPFVLGEYQTNCFVVTPGTPAAGMSCWIVDCGFQPEQMFQWIERHRLRPTAILLTHSHLDHIAGVDRALSRFGRLPLYIHEAEARFCSDAMLNLSALIGMPVTCTEPDHLFKDGEVLELNGSRWRVMHAPGHSPGGACLIHDESNQAIVGDTLFAGSIGRFDFPTSNAQHLRATIQRLMTLPDDMMIYPGHGPKTTIGEERMQNPYVLEGF